MLTKYISVFLSSFFKLWHHGQALYCHVVVCWPPAGPLLIVVLHQTRTTGFVHFLYFPSQHDLFQLVLSMSDCETTLQAEEIQHFCNATVYKRRGVEDGQLRDTSVLLFSWQNHLEMYHIVNDTYRTICVQQCAEQNMCIWLAQALFDLGEPNLQSSGCWLGEGAFYGVDKTSLDKLGTSLVSIRRANIQASPSIWTALSVFPCTSVGAYTKSCSTWTTLRRDWHRFWLQKESLLLQTHFSLDRAMYSMLRQRWGVSLAFSTTCTGIQKLSNSEDTISLVYGNSLSLQKRVI